MLSLSLLLLSVPLVSTVTVNTQSGAVVGNTIYFQGKPVNRFLGIPFAEPPVGHLRFKKPVPVKPWSESRNAVTFPPSCFQYYPFDYPWHDKMPGQSEDCLYLNIWVPASRKAFQKPKAVMFWVYSGGFASGSNRLPVYDGQVVAAEGDVIVVVINYRLGMFGFLSTKIDDAPGNMGLLDVLEALKWTKNNIEAFGGDKNRITVCGHSAGSIIAGYLLISPLSNGLLKRVIMQSGSPMYLDEDPKEQNYQLGQKVAKAVGCASNSTSLKQNPQEVVGCLQTINADVLVRTVNSFNPSGIRTFIPIYGDEFLPVEPRKAFQNGYFQDVDVIVGNVKDEGSVLLVVAFPELFGPYGERNSKINKTLGAELILQLFKSYDFKQDVVDHYLSKIKENDYSTIRSQAYHSFGDFQLFCPSIYFIEGFSQRRSKTYYFYFYHQSANTVYHPWMGVTHFTEVPYVFGRPMDHLHNYTKEEVQLSKALIRMWTNFAKDGMPSSTWKEFSKSDPYIQEFYVFHRDDSYLKQHLQNCNFYRPYLQ